MATVIGVFVLGQGVSKHEGVGIILCLLGVIFIARPNFVFQYFISEDKLENSNVKDNVGYFYVLIGKWPNFFNVIDKTGQNGKLKFRPPNCYNFDG